MDWIKLEDQQPEIGIEVDVKTIYDYGDKHGEDTGIWDGFEWKDSSGKFLGEASEAKLWKYKS